MIHSICDWSHTLDSIDYSDKFLLQYWLQPLDWFTDTLLIRTPKAQRGFQTRYGGAGCIGLKGLPYSIKHLKATVVVLSVINKWHWIELSLLNTERRWQCDWCETSAVISVKPRCHSGKTSLVSVGRDYGCKGLMLVPNQTICHVPVKFLIYDYMQMTVLLFYPLKTWNSHLNSSMLWC